MVDATSTNESQSNGSANQIANDAVTESHAKPEVKSEPNPLVLCGPSGTGKSTILKAVMAQSKYKVRLVGRLWECCGYERVM